MQKTKKTLHAIRSGLRSIPALLLVVASPFLSFWRYSKKHFLSFISYLRFRGFSHSPLHHVHHHWRKHHKKYLFGVFGSFAVVKMVALFAGFLSVLTYGGSFAYQDPNNCTGVPQEAECRVLLNFYNSTNGDNWNNKINVRGNTSTICSARYGIECNAAGHVTIINLENNNVSGYLDLSGLTELTALYINYNRLTNISESFVDLNINTGLLGLYTNHLAYSGFSPTLIDFIDARHSTYNGDWRNSQHCGDGVVNTGEQCDDGNSIGGDGCTNTCYIEPTCTLSMTGYTDRDAFTGYFSYTLGAATNIREMMYASGSTGLIDTPTTTGAFARWYSGGLSPFSKIPELAVYKTGDTGRMSYCSVSMPTCIPFISTDTCSPEAVGNRGFTCDDISSAECLFLIELYDATDGAQWTNSGGWLSNPNACERDGISCMTTESGQQYITSINLSDHNLVGELPSTLDLLLPYVAFGMEMASSGWSGTPEGILGGEIPFGKLTSLNLSNNGLIGNIPYGYFMLFPFLQQINFSNNHFTSLRDKEHPVSLASLSVYDDLSGFVHDETSNAYSFSGYRDLLNNLSFVSSGTFWPYFLLNSAMQTLDGDHALGNAGAFFLLDNDPANNQTPMFLMVSLLGNLAFGITPREMQHLTDYDISYLSNINALSMGGIYDLLRDVIINRTPVGSGSILDWMSSIQTKVTDNATISGYMSEVSSEMEKIMNGGSGDIMGTSLFSDLMDGIPTLVPALLSTITNLLNHLTDVDLSYNDIATVPDYLPLNTCIQSFDLSHNALAGYLPFINYFGYGEGPVAHEIYSEKAFGGTGRISVQNLDDPVYTVPLYTSWSGTADGFGSALNQELMTAGMGRYITGKSYQSISGFDFSDLGSVIKTDRGNFFTYILQADHLTDYRTISRFGQFCYMNTGDTTITCDGGTKGQYVGVSRVADGIFHGVTCAYTGNGARTYTNQSPNLNDATQTCTSLGMQGIYNLEVSEGVALPEMLSTAICYRTGINQSININFSDNQLHGYLPEIVTTSPETFTGTTSFQATSGPVWLFMKSGTPVNVYADLSGNYLKDSRKPVSWRTSTTQGTLDTNCLARPYSLDAYLSANFIGRDNQQPSRSECSGFDTWMDEHRTTVPYELRNFDVCGDGILGVDEECDDGNLLTGDNCNEYCQVSPTCTISMTGYSDLDTFTGYFTYTLSPNTTISHVIFAGGDTGVVDTGSNTFTHLYTQGGPFPGESPGLSIYKTDNPGRYGSCNIAMSTCVPFVSTGLCSPAAVGNWAFQCSDISDTECLFLIELYDATDGAHWTYNDGWMDPENTNACNRDGITCTEINGQQYLQSINLPENNLVGELPSTLDLLLPYVAFGMDIAGGNWSGSVESVLNGEIPFGKLTSLNLSNNGLVGNIPYGYFMLFPFLQQINFSNNHFTSLRDKEHPVSLASLSIYDEFSGFLHGTGEGSGYLEYRNMANNLSFVSSGTFWPYFLLNGALQTLDGDHTLGNTAAFFLLDNDPNNNQTPLFLQGSLIANAALGIVPREVQHLTDYYISYLSNIHALPLGGIYELVRDILILKDPIGPSMDDWMTSMQDTVMGNAALSTYISEINDAMGAGGAGNIMGTSLFADLMDSIPSVVPSVLSTLTNLLNHLTDVDLSNNNIDSLPDYLPLNGCIQSFDLSNNMLSGYLPFINYFGYGEGPVTHEVYYESIFGGTGRVYGGDVTNPAYTNPFYTIWSGTSDGFGLATDQSMTNVALERTMTGRSYQSTEGFDFGGEIGVVVETAHSNFSTYVLQADHPSDYRSTSRFGQFCAMDSGSSLIACTGTSVIGQYVGVAWESNEVFHAVVCAYTGSESWVYDAQNHPMNFNPDATCESLGMRSGSIYSVEVSYGVAAPELFDPIVCYRTGTDQSINLDFSNNQLHGYLPEIITTSPDTFTGTYDFQATSGPVWLFMKSGTPLSVYVDFSGNYLQDSRKPLSWQTEMVQGDLSTNCLLRPYISQIDMDYLTTNFIGWDIQRSGLVCDGWAPNTWMVEHYTGIPYELWGMIPSTPALLSPTSGSNFYTGTIPFIWSRSDAIGGGVSGYVYEVSIDSGFTNLIFSGSTSITGVTLTGILDGSYYRRVLAYNLTGSTGNRSLVSLFRRAPDICIGVTEISEDECRALVHFYDVTNGPNWYNTGHWLDASYICNYSTDGNGFPTGTGWYGVMCSTGHVSMLHFTQTFSGNNLQGELPIDAFSGLPYLQTLNIGYNHLDGTLPEGIFLSLPQLKNLQLYFNNFSGALSTNVFTGLDSIEKIRAMGNNFYGAFPSIAGVGSHITQLVFQANHFSGTIDRVCDAPNLQTLILSNNNFYGEIPNCLTGLTSLTPMIQGGDVYSIEGNYLDVDAVSPVLSGFLWEHLGTGWDQQIRISNLSILDTIAVLSGDTFLSVIPVLNAGPANIIDAEVFMQEYPSLSILTANVSYTYTKQYLTPIDQCYTDFINADTGAYRDAIEASPAIGGDLVVALGGFGYQGGRTGAGVRFMNLIATMGTTLGPLMQSWGIDVTTLTNCGVSGYVFSIPRINANITGSVDLVMQATTGFLQSNTGLSLTVGISSSYGGWNDVNMSNNLGRLSIPNTTCAGVTEISENECLSLRRLYNSTNGSGWTNTGGWLDNSAICNNNYTGWYGVTCTNNHVSQLNLNNNHLVGTLPNLSGLARLKSIDTSYNSGLIVDLSTLQNNCSLTGLILSDRWNSNQPTIQGNLSDLACMTGLVDISFPSAGTTVSGNISVFGGMHNLSEVRMSSSLQVYGDISVFANTPDLSYLYMMSTAISGDIGVFSHTHDLLEIRIDSTDVYGDIGVFSHDNTPSLGNCTITDSAVTGDIAVFNTLTGIFAIYLSSTDVTGDLASLSSITSIRFGLMFADTNVRGDIAALSGMTQITHYLMLDGPNIYGNLSALSGFNTIQLLWISNSRIEGTLDSLLSMTGLLNIDLSNNYLTGDIPVAMMTALPNAGGNISLNFLNVGNVTDPDLTDYLDTNFAGWTNQRIATYLSLTGVATGTAQLGILNTFDLYYANDGIGVSNVGIFVPAVAGMTFSGYTSSTYRLNQEYAVIGDPCYDALMSNTSSGVYYQYMDQSLQDNMGGMTLLQFISNIESMPNPPPAHNYTGGLHETEGQWLFNFCQGVGFGTIQSCLPQLGTALGGLDRSFVAMDNLTCGTGGTAGYLYELGSLSSQSTGIQQIGFTPTSGGAYTLNFQIFALGGTEMTPADNTFSLGLTVTATDDCSAVTEITPTECNALIHFYDVTNGSGWYNTGHWLNTSHICNYSTDGNGFPTGTGWYGVMCSTGHVSMLHFTQTFSGNNLQGELPVDAFSGLSYLQTLNIGYNHLDGTLPEGIFLSLPQLKNFQLYFNNFSGTLSTNVFTGLDSIEKIRAMGNNFYGPFPSLAGIGSHITQLVFQATHFSGTLDRVCDAPNLQTLILSNNNFYGEIPNCLTGLTSLTPMIEQGDVYSIEGNYLDVDGVSPELSGFLWEHLGTGWDQQRRSSDLSLPLITNASLSGNDVSFTISAINTGPTNIIDAEIFMQENTGLSILTANVSYTYTKQYFTASDACYANFISADTGAYRDAIEASPAVGGDLVAALVGGFGYGGGRTGAAQFFVDLIRTMGTTLPGIMQQWSIDITSLTGCGVSGYVFSVPRINANTMEEINITLQATPLFLQSNTGITIALGISSAYGLRTDVAMDNNLGRLIIREATLPTAPILISPTNGTADLTGSISFLWSGAIDTGGAISGYSYQIGTDAVFMNPSFASGTTVSTGITLTGFTERTYYRRVYAFDLVGNTGGRSPTWTFKVRINACAGVTEISETECNALIHFYNELDGPNWINTGHWLDVSHICNYSRDNNGNVVGTGWYGVVCNAGHVSNLVFQTQNQNGTEGNNLYGVLPVDIFSGLTYLTRFSFGNNHLYGTLPQGIFSGLSVLINFQFWGNDFSGELPTNLFTGLDSLSWINLNDNSFYGVFPSLEGISSHIQGIDISRNHFDGTIDWICDATGVQTLKFGYNDFDGDIPECMTGFANLTGYYNSWNSPAVWESIEYNYLNVDNVSPELSGFLRERLHTGWDQQYRVSNLSIPSNTDAALSGDDLLFTIPVFNAGPANIIDVELFIPQTMGLSVLTANVSYVETKQYFTSLDVCYTDFVDDDAGAYRDAMEAAAGGDLVAFLASQAGYQGVRSGAGAWTISMLPARQMTFADIMGMFQIDVSTLTGCGLSGYILSIPRVNANSTGLISVVMQGTPAFLQSNTGIVLGLAIGSSYSLWIDVNMSNNVGLLHIYDTTPPSVPVLISPISGTTFDVEDVSVLWGISTDAGTGIGGYLYQISTTSGFTSLVASGNIATTGVSLVGIADDTYYRRVAAYDALGNISARSNPFTFVISTMTAPIVGTGYIFLGTTGANNGNVYYKGTIDIRASLAGTNITSCEYTTGASWVTASVGANYCEAMSVILTDDIQIQFRATNSLGTVMGGIGTYLYDATGPTTPMVISPIGGTIINSVQTQLLRSPSTDSGIGIGGYYYEILNSSGFVVRNGISTTTGVIIIGLPTDVYSRRVYAYDGLNTSGNRSSSGTFGYAFSYNLIFAEMNNQSLLEKFSPVHFMAPGNNFIGGIIWLTTKSLTGNMKITTLGGQERNCNKQVRGMYFNSQRGKRVWPLDENTLTLLQQSNPNYSQLHMSGGLYTSCLENQYSIFGQVTYSRSGTVSYLIAGTTLRYRENLLGTDLADSFQYFNNRTPLGYVWDSYGGIGFVGGYITTGHEGLIDFLNRGRSINQGFTQTGDLVTSATGDWEFSSSAISGDNANNVIRNMLIQGSVGLSTALDAQDRISLLGNPQDKTVIIGTDTINNATLINQARQNMEKLCKGKTRLSWTTLSRTSQSVLCFENTTLRINLYDDAEYYSGKTIIMKHGDIVFNNSMERDFPSLDIFVDQGNVYLDNDPNNMQNFDNQGYVGGVNSINSGVYLKGTIVINGLLLGQSRGIVTGYYHKFYFQGKISSLNTPFAATAQRQSFITDIIGGGYSGRVGLQNTFVWRCGLGGTGSDGSPCTDISQISSIPFVIIDGKYPSRLLVD